MPKLTGTRSTLRNTRSANKTQLSLSPPPPPLSKEEPVSLPKMAELVDVFGNIPVVSVSKPPVQKS